MLPLGYLLLEPDTKYQGKGTQEMRTKESSKRGPKRQIERKKDCEKQKPLRGKRDGGTGMEKKWEKIEEKDNWCFGGNIEKVLN